jgi:hypothetical protein
MADTDHSGTSPRASDRSWSMAMVMPEPLRSASLESDRGRGYHNLRRLVSTLCWE